MKLDIACGQSKQEGFHGVDIAEVEGVDTVHDLTQFPWPFEDDSVDEAFSSHYVEHTPDLVAFMNEAYRVLKDGAQIRIVHPHLRSDRAFQDPTHTRFIPEATWYYFAKDWREANKLDHYPISADFGVEQMFYSGFYPAWETRAEQARQFALQTYWNVAQDLVVDLKARKAVPE